MTPPSDVDEVTLAPEAILRAVMLSLCDDYPTFIKALEATRALTKLSQSRAAADEGEDSGKRKAEGEIFVCLQCKEVFSTDNNPEDCCSYHPGNLEPDDEGDFWADHDENCHGLIDTEEMRREYPEGFVYDCCDQNGESKGCAKSRHEEQPSKSLRGAGLD